MKNRLFLSLTILLSMALGPVGTGRLQAMNEKDGQNEWNYNKEEEGESDEEEDNVNQGPVYIVKFQDKEFQVPEAVLHSIRQVWKNKDILLNTSEENYSDKNPINITCLVEEITANIEDIKRFFDLTEVQLNRQGNTLSPRFGNLTTEELLTQLKLADKLHCRILIDACGKELINRVGLNYKKEDAQLVEKMIDELSSELCDKELCLLLREKFLKLEESLSCTILTENSNKLLYIDENRIASVPPSGKIIKIFNLNTGHCTQTLEGHPNGICKLLKIDENTIAAAYYNIKIWNLKNGRCIHTFRGHSRSLIKLFKIGKNKIASIDHQNKQDIRVWDLDTGNCKTIKIPHSFFCEPLKIDENKIAVSNKSTIEILDMDAGNCIRTLCGHSKNVCMLLKIDKNTIASKSCGEIIKLWDFRTGNCIKTIENSEAYNFFQFSKYKMGLIDCNGIKIRNMKTGECIRTIKHNGGGSLAEGTGFKISEKRCLIQGKIWDFSRGRYTHLLENYSYKMIKHHTSNPIKINNDTVAIPYNDKTIKIWNLNPFRDITFKQFAFLIALQKEKQKETVHLEEGEEEYKIFYSLPKELQEKLVELGWIKLAKEN